MVGEARVSLDHLVFIAMVTHINLVGDLPAVEMAAGVKVTIQLVLGGSGQEVEMFKFIGGSWGQPGLHNLKIEIAHINPIKGTSLDVRQYSGGQDYSKELNSLNAWPAKGTSKQKTQVQLTPQCQNDIPEPENLQGSGC